MKTLKFFILLFAFSVTLSAGELTESAIAHILAEAVTQFEVPGAALGVVVDEQVLFASGSGMRSKEAGLPVTAETLFPIASCTKAFTTLMLGQLVDEKAIAWDDPVQKYLPEFCLLDSAMASRMTIRDLIAHRTGISRHDPLWFSSEVVRGDVTKLFKHIAPECGLRQEFHYNNLMYSIAGLIVEKVTGQSWEEALFARVLKPLAMRHSHASLEKLKKSQNYALPYARFGNTIHPMPFRDLFTINPGGGINSNVVDMLKWVRFQLSSEKAIIKPQTLQEMHTVHMTFSTPPQIAYKEIDQLGYGLGWFIGNYRGNAFVHHFGNIDGFTSEVAFLPQKKIGLVILTNSSNDGRYMIHSVRNQIFDALLELEPLNWLKRGLEIRNQARQALQKSAQDFVSHQFAHPAVAHFAGAYEHPAYGTVKICTDDKQCFADLNTLRIPLHPKSETIFTAQFDPLLAYDIPPFIDFTFVKDSEGRIQTLQIPLGLFTPTKPIVFNKK